MNNIIKTSNYSIVDLGVHEEWVYDIEVEDNHNFFGNDILVHNSAYLSLKPIMDKYISDNPCSTKNEQVDYCDSFIKEVIDPTITSANTEFSNLLNAYAPEEIVTEREAIADVSIFLNKKKYYMRVLDNEGVRYDEPDIKTMGIEIVRSSTPKFVKRYLLDSIGIILDSTEDELLKWVRDISNEFIVQDLDNIAKTTGINNLQYDLDKPSYKEDGRKITIPINSRAALTTNRYIESNGLSNRYTQVSTGDKAKLLYLRTPNPLGQNVFAFLDGEFAERFREYIDYDLNWEKYFMSPLRIMTDPLNWNIDKETEDIDDW